MELQRPTPRTLRDLVPPQGRTLRQRHVIRVGGDEMSAEGAQA